MLIERHTLENIIADSLLAGAAPIMNNFDNDARDCFLREHHEILVPGIAHIFCWIEGSMLNLHV